MRFSNKQYRARRAFTLLEVLAATAMFSALFAALYSLFFTALDMRDTAYAAIDRDSPRDYAADLLRRDLALCLQPSGVLATVFTGERGESGADRQDRLEFFTAAGRLDDEKPWGDAARVVWELRTPEQVDARGMELVRVVYRNLLATTEEEPDEQVILERLKSLEFTHYDGSTWQDSWDSAAQENAAPRAVRVRLGFLNDGVEEDIAVAPLEIVVPIVVQAPSAGSSPETAATEGGA